MRLLMLGNSNDTGEWFESGRKRSDIIAERLEQDFGQPFEVVVKSLWPNEQMVTVLERWLDDLRPDAVFVNTTTFHYTYESLPLRARRIFGRLGPSMGDAGFKLASSKRWSHNALFRGIRMLGQATLGGDTHCTPDEYVDRYEQAIRLMARHEGMLLILKLPLGQRKPGITKRQQKRAEARRQFVTARLREICARHHVVFAGLDKPLWQSGSAESRSKVGDGLHSDAEGHEASADRLYGLIHEGFATHLAEASRATVVAT